MKSKASILRSSPGEYESAVVELDTPHQHEVLVRLVASGLCHSDDHVAKGDLIPPLLPFCGGHEGAGVVEEVGSAVVGLAPGDHVVFSFIPSCGRCRYCARGQQNLCNNGLHAFTGERLEEPGSFRMTLDGAPVAQLASASTFSEYTLVDQRSLVKVPEEYDLTKICLLGCAVGTGWGAAVNSAAVRPGDTVIVMGVGGIGINAVQGAANAGALHVIAVDPVEFKREKALELGATKAFGNMAEAADFARSVTDGQGADSSIVTVGVTTGEHIAEAFAAIGKGGTTVVTGIGPMTAVGIPVSAVDLTLNQKRLQGSLYGACAPSADVHQQLALYRSGKLKLDELITTTYKIDEISKAYEDLHAGKNIRGVVLFD
ncbi:NDMA-dependent alcohol dehydrogenase [Sporichthya sp.]|uniref:NDMA-dependent alcohol dehydrogenase n=1 Tax=Sporichthya sp. TaxID=65475 RepID=UPI00180D2746|nr:NDMA-dependent alcohol dehydrogenase [Sporichthya sp.]MBA3741446.1 NDMA-dependent alcohol dehydrogenase [Sporichthya sp.]